MGWLVVKSTEDVEYLWKEILSLFIEALPIILPKEEAGLTP
jgi:hypothetical protein